MFAVAAAAKLADREGHAEGGRRVRGARATRRGARDSCFHSPSSRSPACSFPASTAVVGALGALALLLLFSGAIAVSLARGKSPDCHCFGQLHSAPASWKTLFRNVALLAVALFALVGSVVAEPLSAVAWIGELEVAEVVALGVSAVAIVVLAVGGVAFASLMRSYGTVLIRLDRVEAALASAGLDPEDDLEMPEIGLAPGTSAPAFETRTVDGDEVSLETILGSGLPALLLFTSPHCGPCKTLMPTVAEWQREYGDRLAIVVASSGSAADVRAEATEHGLQSVIHDGDNRLYELFDANGTPSAVLIAPDRTIGSWVASGHEWIEQLVEQTVGAGESEGLPVGTDAPALELPSLAGEPVSLASLRGRDTLLLFWNPDCGFCRSMHDDVLAWESSANGVGPRLVVVSSGDPASTRAEGFESLVLLDEDFAAGAAFSANGTPMAVLVDAEGRVASPVVAGAEAALALADAHVATT